MIAPISGPLWVGCPAVGSVVSVNIARTVSTPPISPELATLVHTVGVLLRAPLILPIWFLYQSSGGGQ